MRFDRDWTAVALDAEYDSFGHQRIANAHNALRASVAEKDAEIARLRAKVEKAEALVVPTQKALELIQCWLDDRFAVPRMDRANFGRMVGDTREATKDAIERLAAYRSAP